MRVWNSLHIQQHMIFLCFDSSNPSGYGVVSICGFHLYFPADQWCQTSLIWLSAICIFSWEKSLLRSFSHFKFGYLSFNHWLVRALYIFWIKTPYQIYNLEVFSSTLQYNCIIYMNYFIWSLQQPYEILSFAPTLFLESRNRLRVVNSQCQYLLFQNLSWDIFWKFN